MNPASREWIYATHNVTWRATGEQGFEADGYRTPRLFPQSRRLSVGLPGPYSRPRIHPVDRRRPLRRRLSGQLEVQRFPRHSRAHLRSAVRTRVPPRTRGGRLAGGRQRQGQARTRGDLPLEARRGGFQGRHPRPIAFAGEDEERQARRAGRRGPGVVDRCARSGAARLRMRRVRRRCPCGRHDPFADSQVPPARFRDRRGGRLRPRHGRRVSGAASASTA